jgi:hypothetical protein
VPGLVLLAILVGTPVGEDGPADDPDWIAPYLGLSGLDAEELREDSAGSADSPSSPAHALPFWARLLPDLSLAVQVRTATKLVLAAGAGTEHLRGGLIFIALATFPLSAEPSPGEPTPAVTRAPRAVSLRSEDPGLESTETSPPQGEPTVQELQSAAERASATPLRDLAGWGARARASALLPELTLDYRRNVGEIDTLGIRSDLGIDSHNIEDITRYGARATWQLSQLVFNREEINAAQTAEAIERGRRELLLEVARLFFHRQALLQELLGHLEPVRRSALLMEAAQTAAELDALTGGYLSRHLAKEAP